MVNVKDIIIKRIDSKNARNFVKKWHYSGKVCTNSQLHFGAFYNKRLHGVLQFGSSLDKRKTQRLVADTGWNDFIELNRMAFDDYLPKNSESRCLSVCLRLIKKNCPHIKWVISFADGTQSGHGAIYQAVGFVLTQINVNKSIWEFPEGDVKTDLSLKLGLNSNIVNRTTFSKGKYSTKMGGSASMKIFRDSGWAPKRGFQLRYVYFLDKSMRKNLTCEEIPYSRIKEMGASMYMGKRLGDSGSSENVHAQLPVVKSQGNV